MSVVMGGIQWSLDGNTLLHVCHSSWVTYTRAVMTCSCAYCSVVANFAAKVEEVYCRCFQHKLQAVQLLQIAAQKGKGLYGGR